ncbi:hypothetical protein SEVIR_3G195522v4 [Setaria viridis]
MSGLGHLSAWFDLLHLISVYILCSPSLHIDCRISMTLEVSIAEK